MTDQPLVEALGDAFADCHNALVGRGRKIREPTCDELALAALPIITREIEAAFRAGRFAGLKAQTFVATVGIRRQERQIDSIGELLRLINGGAALSDIYATQPVDVAAIPTTLKGTGNAA